MPRKVNGRDEEKKFAKKQGLRAQPNSGALKPPHLKGDVVSDTIVIDLKSTDKSQYTVKLKEMWKVEKEALAVGKMPLLVINFCQEHRQFAVVRYEDYKEMEAFYQKYYGVIHE